MKEDYAPAAPTQAPNTSLGIKAGPVFIGKQNKDKKSSKSTQGSQRPPMDTQIIMAHKTFSQRLVEKITAKDVKMHLAVHAKIDALAKQALEGKPDSEVEVGEAFEWDKQPVDSKKKRATANPMDKTNKVYTSANETLSPSASSGDWIHDFVHSKNSKFEGKSRKERIRMALGAYYAHHKEELQLEGVAEHEKFKDPTTHPYHKTLTAHGFQHVATYHKTIEFAPKALKDSGRADYTEHHYTHPHHGKSHVIVHLEHDPTIGHGGMKSKGHHFLHRHEQSNGIMAPSSGENKNHLHRSLSYHYGVPKGMEAPKPTAHEKKYPHTAAHYKMNEAVESLDELEPLFENFHHRQAEFHRMAMQKAKEAGNLELATHHEGKMEFHRGQAGVTNASYSGAAGHPHQTDKRAMGENFAEWHETMEKKGTSDKPVEFRIKNAGGRTEAHLNGKRVGAYNHERREAIKEDKIFEAGSSKDKMKRAYMGKVRGTTATGKPAHAVIIDPIIKPDKDQNLATMKANARMPAPDRGL